MKAEARDVIRDHKPGIVLVALAYLVIMWVLQVLSVKLQFPGMALRDIYGAWFDTAAMENALKASLGQTYMSRVIGFLLNIMGVVVGAGFTLACLKVSRRMEAGVGELFDCFAFLLKVMWLNILTGLLVAAWSVLLVVPGIIAAYRYSFAMFVLLDDPRKGVVTCLRESRELTDGHKTELFLLNLSFIGWILLSMIPGVGVYSLPYMEIAKANYYCAISGRYAPAPQAPYDSGTGWDA